MTPAKYISKYQVWLEIQNSEIRIYDQNRENYLILGQLTKNGIERNRNVEPEQSLAIGLLYPTAERYFCHNKDSLNKITARCVWLDFWLELHDLEVRLYSRTGEDYMIIGELDDEEGIKLDENFIKFVFSHNNDFFRFYEIALRLFSAREKELTKQVQEQKLLAKRKLIQNSLKQLDG
ncbi:hypothetical protein C7Y66_10840 [Chroococcidiopsis sp. CCALA 051]|uniref:hypothetical protein n=1 Tax=Chroococcidiopsis sp. CCALA 051 TaxID=869949 RepID=UPI000D0D41C9|nr:hypothetical protein [Chroococcidiopsis sp. CCALA 051]MBE9020583.1 hypothetical protein [Chroococcidiopsidales cyanobacterium LEGE 13417]PSM49114.1 hypothetical protein C7Y66_10840 [Chroococcidiopsis sp. CCALA 051]